MIREQSPASGSGRFGPGFLVAAVGLLAAGVSSAITAPLAASYAIGGVMGWSPDHPRFKLSWLFVLGVGAIFALLGTQPIATIRFAQAANGVLLPIVAVCLFRVMNSRPLLGEYRNGWKANLGGGLVVLVAAGLGLFLLRRAFAAF